MSLTPMDDFIFKHVNQADQISGDPATFKTNMDSQAKAIRDYLIGAFKTYIDSNLNPTSTDGSVLASAKPSSFGLGVNVAYVSAANGFPTSGVLLTTRAYPNSGGGVLQILTPYDSSNYGFLQYRFGDYNTVDHDTFNGWTTIPIQANTPIIPTSSAGIVGEWKKFGAGDNTALNLPAGGKWAYSCSVINTAAGTFYDTIAGVANGGSQIYAATVGKTVIGFCWRIV